MEKEFYPEFERQDLINLERHNIYLRLAIDGKASKPFSALTLPPFFKFERQENKEKIIEVSRMRYAKKREEIKGKIEKWGRYDKGNKENKQAQLSFKTTGH